MSAERIEADLTVIFEIVNEHPEESRRELELEVARLLELRLYCPDEASEWQDLRL